MYGAYDYGMDDPSSIKRSKDRHFTVKLNGNSYFCQTLRFMKNEITKFLHLKMFIKKQLSLKINDFNTIRIFNNDGYEQFEEDLEFLNFNGENLFVSLGEDFDHITYINEYEIQKVLGIGGFGKVYLAKHKINGEQIAIKVTKEDAIDNADDIDSIFAEAETLKMLEHDGIVKIFNCFIIKKTLQAYFIMEYQEGGEMLDYVQEKKFLSEEESKIYFIQIIAAIDYCHRQKIIHRDMKLENVLRKSTTGTDIKIVDFGIAGLCAGRKSEVTKAGSLNYMPPETLKAKNVTAGPALDIWAIGCMLYAMVLGELPFIGKTDMAQKKAIIEDPLKFPETNQKLSIECKDILLKMLEKDPEERINISEIKDHPWYKEETIGQNLEKEYMKRLGLCTGSDKELIKKIELDVIQEGGMESKKKVINREENITKDKSPVKNSSNNYLARGGRDKNTVSKSPGMKSGEYGKGYSYGGYERNNFKGRAVKEKSTFNVKAVNNNVKVDGKMVSDIPKGNYPNVNRAKSFLSDSTLGSKKKVEIPKKK